MGQEQTIKIINDLKFTTLKELVPMLSSSMGKSAVTKSLCKLIKSKEVIPIKLKQENLYICGDFYKRIKQ